jgi:hypothetical protein
VGRLGLDLVVTALGAAMIVSSLVLGPTAEAGGENTLQMAFSIAYPAGDMILIVWVVSLLLRGVPESTRRALRYLTAGLVLFIVGDVIYAYVTLHGVFTNADFLNITYVVAFALFALAGASQVAVIEPQMNIRPAGRRLSWAPTLGAATGFVVLLV